MNWDEFVGNKKSGHEIKVHNWRLDIGELMGAAISILPGKPSRWVPYTAMGMLK